MAKVDTNEAALLELTGIVKRFHGVTALNGVDLRIKAGQVHAVIGENGAGKSTLMKILAGVQPPDAGEIRVDGKPVQIRSVDEALRMGIALIHQELNLADNLDIGANIFLGREPTRFGMIDFRRIANDSEVLLQKVGLDVSPSTTVSHLTIGLQQLVEIAKAISVDARVIIMDEPTSSLSQRETESLFKIIEELKAQGVAIIYISHRLSEIEKLADEVTVLRDGEFAGKLDRDEICHTAMVELMVGRDISQYYARNAKTPGDVVLEAKELVTTAWPSHQVSFGVRASEIVGIAGLVGSGRTELLTTLFGVTPPVKGEVLVNGKAVQVDNCRSAIAAGLALVPEDRKGHGAILAMSIRNNIGLANLGRFKRPFGFHNRAREKLDSTNMISELLIKAPNDQQFVQFLSGGNQQKVVIGKWLATDPKVLLMDEPTRGVDIGAKQEIYRLMEELAAKGVAVLFVSSELEEVLSMSDRVLVMHEGKLMGQLSKDEMSEEAIMLLATGRNDQLNADQS